MPLVQAWYDPHKKKYFRRKEDYLVHLRAVARARIQNRRVNTERDDENLRIEAFRLSVSRVGQIEDWLMANFSMLVRRGRRDGMFGADRIADLKLLGIDITLNGPRPIACTHNAPLGKKSNWAQKPDLPTHYQGYRGRIDIKYSGYSFETDLLRKVMLYPGTGGGGDHHLSYELTVWEDDFPQLMG